MRKITVALLGGTALAMLASVPAGAQQEAASDQTRATTSETIESVVVNARRRQEDMQSVPVSITAYSSQELTERHIVNQVDLANNTPSLTAIQSGYPGEMGGFVLRGQGPAYNGTSGTVTYFAEAPDPYGSLDGRVGSYYDLANIQVLKGPQGTLFGKNATGGNVLFEPQKPTNELGGYLQGQVGDFGEVEFDGAFNLPVIDDKVLFRAAGTIERRHGYTTDVGTTFSGKDYDNIAYQGFRLELLLKPIEGLESLTIYRYQTSNTHGPGTALYAINTSDPTLVGEFNDQQARGVRKVAYGLDEYTKLVFSQIMNVTSYAINDNLTIKNIAGYTRNYDSYGYEYSATPLPTAGQTSPGQPTGLIDYYSEELQVQGKAFGGHLQYSAGGFLDDMHSPRQTQFDYIVAPNFAIPVYQTVTDRSSAAFAQGTYDFSGISPVLEGLSATAGYRYTWEYTASSSAAPAAGLAASGATKFRYGSYTFDIDYQLSSSTMIYASLRDAYRAGGFNSTVPAGSDYASYPPEKLVNKEIGIKSTNQLFGIETRINADAFFGDYTNIQRQVVVNIPNGAGLTIPAQVVESAAKGEINGIEFEGVIVPISGLELTLNYTHTQSAYTKVLPAAVQILKGSPFPFLPKNKVSLAASYAVPIDPAIGELTFSGVATYQSKQSIAQDNSTLLPYMPGYGVLNLRLDLEHIAGNPVGLAFFVTNALNNTYVTGQFDSLVASGWATRTYGAPRMVGMQLHYSFGMRD